MKRVFETAECEEVRNSMFWELRYEKHENQMKGCAVELRLSDWQMNTKTLWAYDKAECVHMCWVAGNTVWSHMASDIS